MKKMFIAMYLLSFQACKSVFFPIATLTIKDKKLVESYFYFRQMTPDQREAKKDEFPEDYAFYSLLEAKIDENGGVDNRTCFPPEKIDLGEGKHAEKIKQWVKEQPCGWISLNLGDLFKRESTIKQRFGDDLKDYVVECDTETVYLSSKIDCEYRKYIWRIQNEEREKKNREVGEKAIERLKKLRGKEDKGVGHIEALENMTADSIF